MAPIERDLRIGRPGDVDREKPVLILMVGLPRSGKTTWARQQDVPVVNPDALRLAMHGRPFLTEAEPWIWTMLRTMIKALFLSGHHVVIMDACNNTRRRRRDWDNPLWRVAFKNMLPTPSPTPELAAECVRRARATAREDLIAIIDNMVAAWEPLTPGEGSLLEDLLPEP